MIDFDRIISQILLIMQMSIKSAKFAKSARNIFYLLKITVKRFWFSKADV
jgi:hypothetical protein